MQAQQQRQVFQLALSIGVIGIVLGVTYSGQLFGEEETPSAVHLLPYLTATAGVLIFIMDTARRKADTWSLAGHWGDQVFRVAQAHAYLFVILWLWPTEGEETPVALRFQPHMIGFLVGLFILRVERAMGGLGERFEELLASIFTRSFADVKRVERRRQEAKAIYRLDEVVTQWDAIRPRLEDAGARADLDRLIAAAREAADGDDAKVARDKIGEAVRAFEAVRARLGVVPGDAAPAPGVERRE